MSFHRLRIEEAVSVWLTGQIISSGERRVLTYVAALTGSHRLGFV